MLDHHERHAVIIDFGSLLCDLARIFITRISSGTFAAPGETITTAAETATRQACGESGVPTLKQIAERAKRRV